MKNWFLQKNDYEQKVIAILAVFTVLVLLYTFLFLPLKRTNTQLQNSINDIQAEIVSMQSLAEKIAQFSNRNVKTVVLEDSEMMVVIDQIAKQQQLTLSNIKSQGKNKISVTLTSVPFNAAMRWLDILQTQQHINISQLNVEAEKQGLTTISMILSH